MFHLFTLQGKRIDAPLEHLPRNIKVHNTEAKNRVRKFVNGEPDNQSSSMDGRNRYMEEVYRETSRVENNKLPVYHVSEIMTSPVYTINQNFPADKLWQEFIDKNVHHLPVLSDDEKITGIVSDRDFLKKMIGSNFKIETDSGMTVNYIMSTDVIAAAPLTDIRRIARAMFDHHIGAMPVIDNKNSIAGIVTRSDILYAIIHQPELNLWA